MRLLRIPSHVAIAANEMQDLSAKSARDSRCQRAPHPPSPATQPLSSLLSATRMLSAPTVHTPLGPLLSPPRRRPHGVTVHRHNTVTAGLTQTAAAGSQDRLVARYSLQAVYILSIPRRVSCVSRALLGTHTLNALCCYTFVDPIHYKN